ncbi:MAG: PilZ domain-containing protein [Anaeromyxobacter sp.]|nr:PilZ domain-containing protein [Anaeromyxobacter sp.]MBL0277987.1 PilZ domain-containing protein [Anaeromyxobacter sp.]
MVWPWKGTPGNEEAERRASARLDKVFPVWLEGDRGGAHGVARNISPGGLFVETPVTQPIGSQVRVTFEGGPAEMVGVGEVRYVCALTGQPASPGRGPVGVRGMGLRFLYFEAAPEVRQAIPARAGALH